LKNNYGHLRFFALFSVIILIAVAFHPAIDPVWKNIQSLYDEDYSSILSFASASKTNEPIIVESTSDQDVDIAQLTSIAQANNDNDADMDGLYDSVEKVLGTDIHNNDTDFDGLNDWIEVVTYNTDPLQPDSNYDGLSDYQEVYNISLDVDNDNVPNPWDVDNDNDGVTDDHDLSPFSTSKMNDYFNIDIKTNNNASTLDIQVVPKDKNHLTLSMQYWDWPEDDQGIMKDLNNSKKDIFILPYIEMTVQTDFKIISEQSGKCLEVAHENISENATIQQQEYTGKTNQQWSIIPQPEGYVSIQASHSGKCLAVYQASKENNASLVQQQFTGADYQLWKLYPISNTSYAIISKHSEKCVEIFNASMQDNATAIQSEYKEEPQQIWFITDVHDFLPAQEELVDYGATIQLNQILFPLTPIWDVGVAPAFNGKMHFPSTNGLSISTKTKLLWKVYGNSDTEQKALIAQNGMYVSANNSGSTLIANGTETGDGETFEWVILGPDRIGLKASNGKYVTLTKKYENLTESGEGIDVLTASADEIKEKETFKIVEKEGNAIGLKTYNGKYITINNPYDDNYQLTATSNSIDAAATFIKEDIGYISHPTPLVSYYEDFKITGFNVQEYYGSQVGCFYNEDINQTIKAGFVTAYDFLRNNTDLNDLNTVMQNMNITINASVRDNLTSQDESIFSLMSELLPSSYHYLSNHTNNTVAPIIIAMQDSFTQTTLDDISSYTIFQGKNISIDLTDKPVITNKVFKMNWYNLTNISLLSIDEVLAESMRWGLQLKDPNNENNTLDNTTLTLVMGLFNTWNMGEYKITKVGTENIYFNIDEAPAIFNYLQYSFFTVSTTIDIIKIIQEGSHEYRFLAYTANIIKRLLAPLGRALKTGLTAALKALRLNKVAVKALNALRSFGNAIKSSRAAQGIIKFFKSAKLLSFLDKIGTALIIIDLVITGVIAFYMFWSILFETGFSEFGAALGAWVVIFSFVYAGVYILLSLVLPIIGIILAILDMIFDFFGKLLNLFLSWVTKTEMRSEFNLGFISGPDLIQHDYDNNGFDVGDRLEFLAQMFGTVKKTSHGNWGDVYSSYVHPSLKLSVPEGSTTGGYNTKIATTTDGNSYRNETYDMGIWADPISMSNFPLTLQLSYDYKIYYNECVWFFGWWCDRESDSDTVTDDITTLYFDVFPGNLTAFTTWSELTPLDSDGDGLSNQEELTHGSNPWRVDTDADGLWDKYEVDNGLKPYSSDSDQDGLQDKIEIELGSDFNKSDTDNDGLTDVEEYKGWQIHFTFWDTPIDMQVSSDLLENDTDHDGLTDLEEYMKGLNPRSNDTDANGILDPDEFIVPYQGFIQQIEFNQQGNSIRVAPNTTINTSIFYRIKGMNCFIPFKPSNCSIIITIENESGNILFNHSIFLESLNPYNITFNHTSFSFNFTNDVSNKEGLYLVKYYTNWECFGILPPTINQRELIGIIDINSSAETNNQWECYDITGGDTDGDLISNLHEYVGWMVTYTTATGTYTQHVTSDPGLIDTDSDGEWDTWEHNCFANSTNPRDPDTDDDGLTDWEEKYLYYTNPLHYDSDGEGLDDQSEIQYHSDPWDNDTDDDGLTDWEEFNLGSNPNKIDTDSDGLTDYEEVYITNSSVLHPDTDKDTLFDKKEYELGTNPRDNDTDDDGLIDGYELIVGTNPKKADTDDDNLNDYKELYWGTNATNPDSDNDRLNDGDELLYGTHPLLKDTDRDGINDFEDQDTYAPQVSNILLAYDLDENIIEFKQHLEQYVPVTEVSLQDLLTDETYRNASYIVLVGKLDAGNETIGNLSKSILDYAGEDTKAIIDSGHPFFASKSSVWNETQTIVMLSHPYRLDHLIVLNMLKTMWKTFDGSTMHIQWPTNRTNFNVEAVNELGIMLWAELTHPATPSISITRYNASTAIPALTSKNGLDTTIKPTGIYLDIDISDNIQNDTGDIIDDAWIVVYYTAQDLDMNGDGDAKDVGDINEKALAFYWFNEKTNKYIKITDKLDWVFETGVDTTNVELYGKQFEGYFWAHVSHFSFYSLAGSLIVPPPKKETGTPVPAPSQLTADASASDQFGFVGMNLTFNASKSSGRNPILSYTWDFGDGTIGEGKQAYHVFTKPGLYPVLLTVTDSSDESDIDEIYVSISIANNPPSKPVITGNMTGTKGVKCTYYVTANDVDEADMIRYGWDWNNDNLIDEWTDYTSPGNQSIINHTFSSNGFYRIKVLAEDTTKARSAWSDRFLVFIDVNYQEQENGSILIDNEKDGTWDSSYDPSTDTLSPYPFTWLSSVLILIIIIIILIAGIILHLRRKKNL